MEAGRTAAIARIRDLASECARSGWDGAEARAISPAAALKAQELLRALPGDLPLPEVAPEPEGSISFDWICARDRVFSLSVCEEDRLAYAWLDGPDRGHAVARFDGRSVPPRILQGIEGIVKGVYAAVGSR